MLAAVLTLAALTQTPLAQNPSPPVAQGFSPATQDCSSALAKGVSNATAQVCLAEAEFERAQAAVRNSAAWSQSLKAAS